MDESLPVNGVHYQESFWRDYPDEAYTLAKAYIAHEKPAIAWGKVLWRLVPDRPIFMGESYFVRGNNPAAFSQFAGEGCFAGWGPATQQGAGLLAKMLAEGYRWHGVAAHHFWLGSEDATLHYNSWKPVCVLCRQWNWTFGGGSTVRRTLKVFNDTRYSDPIEMGWELAPGRQSGGRSEADVPAWPGATRRGRNRVPDARRRHADRRTVHSYVQPAGQGGLSRGEDRRRAQSRRGTETVARPPHNWSSSIRRDRRRPGSAAAESPSRKPKALPTCRPKAA